MKTIDYLKDHESPSFFGLTPLAQSIDFEEIESKEQKEMFDEAMINHSTLSDDQDSGSSGSVSIGSVAGVRVNIYNSRPQSQGKAYYLPEGGAIEFFLHDKPIEFYGRCACLVRNSDLPGKYAIRVPAGTELYSYAHYRKMFHDRHPVESREQFYLENGPYVHEREIGVNCGTHDYPTNINYELFTDGQLQEHRPEPRVIYVTPNRHESINYFRSTGPQNFAVYPEMVGSPPRHFDGTPSPTVSSPIRSDQGVGRRGFVYREDIEFHPSNTNNARGHGDAIASYELQRTPSRADIRANSSGYGRVYSTAERPFESFHEQSTGLAITRQFNSQHQQQQQQQYPRLDGIYDGNSRRINRIPQNFQQGTVIVASTTRPIGDNPASLPPRHLNKKTNALYKTEMCRNWNEIGECRYGRSCQFAHGKKELRIVPRHGQWKTKTCMAWMHGGCTYGSRCCYAHEVITTEHPSSSGDSAEQQVTPVPESGESKFSDFFASRCWT